MHRILGKFVRSNAGSFVPILALSIVPLVLAFGMSIDYTSAVSTKSSMQNALDAATLSLTTLPRTASDADRQLRLQDSFLANRGHGTAALTMAAFDPDGTFRASASAQYKMPTMFMNIARINDVSIGVSTAVVKKPSLVQATFKIDKTSGYWNKTVTLYGTKFDEAKAIGLMQIKYEFNGSNGAKGYGTTTILTPGSNAEFTVTKQKQVCTSTAYNTSQAVPPGSFIDGSFSTNCQITVGTGTGALIDVSQMNVLYLQMDVPSGNPKVLKSNDPNTSDRLYLDGIEVKKGTVVDIFTSVPCGQPSSQAWEDGGSAVPAPVAGADVFYTVTGKCDYSQRVSQARISR